MIQKAFVEAEGGCVVHVTFSLPKSTWADHISLVGEFNDWSATAHPLLQDHEGTWMLSVDLEPDRTYPLCYLRDGQWTMDDRADGYIWDTGGRHLFLVITTRKADHVRQGAAPPARGEERLTSVEVSPAA
jgi:1,4-alpha-glucan branching enzyme